MLDLFSFSLPYIFVIFSVTYCIWLFVSRLLFSPIATFPGPKLAALTFWYEFYYDVVLRGRYTWKIEELHKRYGSIIRINPFELHVIDPAFYDEVYVGNSRKTDKWHWSAKMFGTSLAAVGTTSHELHAVRRKALNPFFSRRSVTQLEPGILANVQLLNTRLKKELESGGVVNISDAFACLAADTISDYAFGESYGLLLSPKFSPQWSKFMMDLSAGTMLMKQFGWVYEILNAFPESFVAMFHPLTRKLINLKRGIADQVLKSHQTGKNVPTRSDEHSTIFRSLMASQLSKSELTLPRLTDEALTLVGAGTITTAHTLTTIFYHLLADPLKLDRLRNELEEAGAEKLSWAQLEHLPYLSACISEGLRLSYGVSHRLQRISPDKELIYRDKSSGVTWVIPKGVPVSMTNMFIHNDRSIFKEPKAFIPERWLEDFDPPSSSRRKFLVPFSRGTRSCVGMNLAYAELFLTVCTVLGPVRMGGIEAELFGTDISDVEVAHDFFNPSSKLDSKGVRLRLRLTPSNSEEAMLKGATATAVGRVAE